ncbi:hypothetical protein Tco_0921728 [Tanacetum coccineum]
MGPSVTTLTLYVLKIFLRCFHRIEAPSDVANGKHELCQLRYESAYAYQPINFYPFRCCHKAKKLAFLHPKAPFFGPDAWAISYKSLVWLKDIVSIDTPSRIVLTVDHYGLIWMVLVNYHFFFYHIFLPRSFEDHMLFSGPPIRDALVSQYGLVGNYAFLT